MIRSSACPLRQADPAQSGRHGDRISYTTSRDIIQSSVAPLSDVLRPLEKRVLIRSTTGRKSAQCCGANTLPIIYLEVRRTGARQLEFTCYKTRALRRNGKAQSAWRG